MSGRRHEHSDEHNTNKHVCVVHSIQTNSSTMSNDHFAITLVIFFCEKYLLAK